MSRLRIDPVKPAAAPRMLELTVASSRRVTPSVQRVTLTGAADLEPLGFDQWFRLLVTRPGQQQLRLLPDVGMVSYVRYVTLPEQVRPLLRNYTVREIRGDELDIDVVVHGEVGAQEVSAAAWAVRATPGMPAAVLDEGRMWNPPADTTSVVVVGDASGLPAVRGICRDLDPETRGVVVLEVPEAADAADVHAPAGVAVHLVHPADHHDVPGVAALAAFDALAALPPSPYVFAVGEQALAAGVRRGAVERGVPKHHITFSGYWRHGQRAYR